MTDPGDHFAYPSRAPDAPARSFDKVAHPAFVAFDTCPHGWTGMHCADSPMYNQPARCWLWDHDLALKITGELLDYMDGDVEQANACRALREARSRLDFPDGATTYVCAHHSTFAQSVSDIWNANKEVHVAKQPLTYENRSQYVQNTDGVAHLAYFDKSTQLSFTWNGSIDSTITVSHGGYSEAPRETFEWTYGTFDLNDTNGVEAGVGLLKWFERACQRYLTENYGVPALVTAFRAGLQGYDAEESRGYSEYDAETAIGQAFRAGRSIRGDITVDY